jgi:hypothetical protein
MTAMTEGQDFCAATVLATAEAEKDQAHESSSSQLT